MKKKNESRDPPCIELFRAGVPVLMRWLTTGCRLYIGGAAIKSPSREKKGSSSSSFGVSHTVCPYRERLLHATQIWS